MSYRECLEALKTARTNSHYLAILHTALMTGDDLEGAEYDHVCRLSREATPIADQSNSATVVHAVTGFRHDEKCPLMAPTNAHQFTSEAELQRVFLNYFEN